MKGGISGDENHSACAIVMRITFAVSDSQQLVWPGRDAKGYAGGREGGAETEDQTAKGPDVGSVEASKLGRPNSKGEPLVTLMLTAGHATNLIRIAKALWA